MGVSVYFGEVVVLCASVAKEVFGMSSCGACFCLARLVRSLPPRSGESAGGGYAHWFVGRVWVGLLDCCRRRESV